MNFLATGGVNEALTTAFSSIASNLNTVIGDVVPVGLGIVGSVMVVTFGIKMFKKITGRA